MPSCCLICNACNRTFLGKVGIHQVADACCQAVDQLVHEAVVDFQCHGPEYPGPRVLIGRVDGSIYALNVLRGIGGGLPA